MHQWTQLSWAERLTGTGPEPSAARGCSTGERSLVIRGYVIRPDWPDDCSWAGALAKIAWRRLRPLGRRQSEQQQHRQSQE